MTYTFNSCMIFLVIDMKIIVLTENTTNLKNFESEHGLSLYIETAEHKILFDMGQSDLFIRNAHAAGVNLPEVDFAVLSHGHYDHGGGMGRFLEINTKAPVYANKNVFGDYYNASFKYIGLDKELSKNNRLILVDDFAKITTGLTLFSCNGNSRPNDKGSFGLSELVDGKYIPDRFLHEQYLFIEENCKKILISGCSHKGVLDIVSWFEPDVLIGGFHYSKIEDNAELEQAAKLLNTHNTQYYTCHCTGVEQFDYMKKFMPKLNYISCGDKIIL